jgi:hypothetical protein
MKSWCILINIYKLIILPMAFNLVAFIIYYGASPPPLNQEQLIEVKRLLLANKDIN